MEAFGVLLRDTLIVTAMLVLPVLVLATVVGAAVAVVQAATQVQEQTLTLLPKILVVGALVTVFGRFGLDTCARLLLEAVARIPELVRG